VESTFSVEMKSKVFVKSISISNGAHDGVLFEGDLGQLSNVSLVEGDVMEIKGENGTLRVGVTEEQLHKALIEFRKLSPCSKVGSMISTIETR